MDTPDYSKYYRHSIRLAGYDYSQPGVYFVTICTCGRNPLFGNVVDCQIRLNERGRVAQVYWFDIPVHFPNSTLDEFVIMPDHVHGIIVITDVVFEGTPVAGEPVAGVRVVGTQVVGTQIARVSVVGAPVVIVGAQHAAPQQLQPGSIPVIVRSYKSAVTKHIREMCGMAGTPVWQRNYWEHIIRNEDELERIRDYIRNNPIKP